MDTKTYQEMAVDQLAMAQEDLEASLEKDSDTVREALGEVFSCCHALKSVTEQNYHTEATAWAKAEAQKRGLITSQNPISKEIMVCLGDGKKRKANAEEIAIHYLNNPME